jgi:hypothetical protein
MPSDSFEENTGFQLPGLGSAEKDTPGSFREGAPLYKVNGDPEPEVSQELTDIKDAQKKAETSNTVASITQAIADKNKSDLNNKLVDADATPVKDSTQSTYSELEQSERDHDLAKSVDLPSPEGGSGAFGLAMALKNRQK